MVTRTALPALVAALAVAALSGTSCVERPSTATIERQFALALAKKDRAAAAKYADAAAKADLDKVGGRMFRARLAGAFGQWAQATRLALEAIRLRPTYGDARAFLGDCYLAQGRLDDARKAYQTAYEQDPTSFRAVMGLVAVSEKAGHADAYEYWLNLAYKLHPADAGLREHVTARRQQREPPERVIPYRETILREHPQDRVNMKHLAALYERVGQLSKAEKLYRRMVALSKSSAESVSLLTDLLRRTDRDAEARRLLIEHIDSSTDKAAAQRVFAQYLENADDHEMAQRAYEKAVRLAPKDARGCAALARFHARRGQWADAVKQHLRYLEKAGEAARPAAERELVGWLIEGKQFDEAHRRAGEAVKKDPRDAEMYALDGLAYLKQRRYAKAKASLDKALRIEPNSPRPLVCRARVHLAAGRWALARDDLERARRRGLPINMGVVIHTVFEEIGDFDSAHAVLSGILADHPGNRDALQALVLLCQRHRRWSQLKPVLAEARKIYPRELFYVVAEAEMLLKQGRAPAAAKLLAAAKKVLPETAPITVLEMRALLGAGRTREALAVGKDLQGHPDVGPEVMALAGRAHAMKKQQAKADRHFTLAVKDAKVGAQTEFVVGQIRKAYGPKTAAEKLAKWVTLRKDNWQIRLLLGNMLLLEGQSKAAERQLLKALKQDMSNHDRFLVTRQLGLAYYEMGDYKKSLEFYRKALALDPKDGITLNNLAWLLAVNLKDPDAAMPYVKRALEREPYNPHTLDTYCVVLMAKGKLAEAVEVLERAADIRPLPAILLHLGQAYEKMGRKEDALRAYRRGWEKVKDDPGHPYYRALHDTLKRLGEQPEGDDETDTPHDPTTETRARRPKG